MSELETILRNYGLWALLFGAAVEGDITLLLAGMLMHLGVWRPSEALAVGAAGGLAGDTFYFWLLIGLLVFLAVVGIRYYVLEFTRIPEQPDSDLDQNDLTP